MPLHGLAGRNQKVAYWACVGRDASGQPVLSADPITLKVRWDNTVRTVLLPDGNPIAIDATVVVDRVIPLGSVMAEGGVESLPGSAQVPDRNAYEVVTFNKVPDWKGRRFYYEATLIRKRDSV